MDLLIAHLETSGEFSSDELWTRALAKVTSQGKIQGDTAQALMQSWYLPKSVRKTIIKNGSKEVREAFALRPDLDDKDLILLANDRSSEVVLRAASHPNASEEVINKAARRALKQPTELLTTVFLHNCERISDPETRLDWAMLDGKGRVSELLPTFDQKTLASRLEEITKLTNLAGDRDTLRKLDGWDESHQLHLVETTQGLINNLLDKKTGSLNLATLADLTRLAYRVANWTNLSTKVQKQVDDALGQAWEKLQDYCQKLKSTLEENPTTEEAKSATLRAKRETLFEGTLVLQGALEGLKVSNIERRAHTSAVLTLIIEYIANGSDKAAGASWLYEMDNTNLAKVLPLVCAAYLKNHANAPLAIYTAANPNLQGSRSGRLLLEMIDPKALNAKIAANNLSAAWLSWAGLEKMPSPFPANTIKHKSDWSLRTQRLLTPRTPIVKPEITDEKVDTEAIDELSKVLASGALRPKRTSILANASPKVRELICLNLLKNKDLSSVTSALEACPYLWPKAPANILVLSALRGGNPARATGAFLDALSEACGDKPQAWETLETLARNYPGTAEELVGTLLDVVA